MDWQNYPEDIGDYIVFSSFGGALFPITIGIIDGFAYYNYYGLDLSSGWCLSCNYDLPKNSYFLKSDNPKLDMQSMDASKVRATLGI